MTNTVKVSARRLQVTSQDAIMAFAFDATDALHIWSTVSPLDLAHVAGRQTFILVEQGSGSERAYLEEVPHGLQ